MPLRMSMEATPADTTVNDISAIKSLNNSLVGVNLTLYGGATLFGVTARRALPFPLSQDF